MTPERRATSEDGQEKLVALCFYVPVSHADPVKEAVFQAGGGRLGRYDMCCWQTPGRGQYRPLPGSDAYQGRVGQLETVEELKVELVCAEACLEAVVEALIHSHPYETPAYHFWRVNRSLT